MDAKRKVTLDTAFGKVSVREGLVAIETDNKEIKIVVNGVEYKPVNDEAKISVDTETAYNVGKSLYGWYCLGVEEDGKYSWAKPEAVRTWKDAIEFAKAQNAHLGSDKELDLLQKAIKTGSLPTTEKGYLKGNFNVNDSNDSGWVWGSDMNPRQSHLLARVQRLSDGQQGWDLQKKGFQTILFCSGMRPGA